MLPPALPPESSPPFKCLSTQEGSCFALVDALLEGCFQLLSAQSFDPEELLQCYL